MNARRALRLGLLAVAALLVLAIALLTVLQSAPVRRRALREVQAALREDGLELEARGLDYRLHGLTVVLDGLTLRSLAAPELPPIVRAERIEATLGLRLLLQRRIWLEDVTIVGARVHVVREADGRTNLPEIAGRSGPGGLELRRLVARGVTLRLDDAATGGTVVELPHLDVGATGEDLRIDLRAPGTLTRDGRQIDIAEVALDARADLSEGRADVRSLRLVTRAGDATASGHASLTREQRSLELDLVCNLRLGPLAELAGLPVTAWGEVRVVAAVSGPFERLAGTASVSGHGLSLAGLDGIDAEAEVRFDPVSQEVVLERARLSLADGCIDASGGLSLATPALAARLDATIERLPLEPLGRALDLPLAVSSSASGRIELRTTDIAHTPPSLTASLTLSPTRAQAGRHLLPLSGALGVQAGGGRTALSFERLQVLSASVDGRVDITSDHALAGSLVGEVASVADLDRDLRLLLGAPASRGSLAEGAVRIAAELGGTLERPQVEAAVTSDALSLARLPAATLEARIVHDGSHTATATATLCKDDARLEASAELGLADGSIAARLHAAALPARTLLDLAGRADLPLDGPLELEAQATGSWSALAGSGRLSSAGLTWAGQSLGPLVLTLGSDSGQARLEAILPELALTATGRLSLTAPHAAELTVEAAGTELERLPLGLTPPLHGRLAGALRLQAPRLGRAAAIEAVTMDLQLAALTIEREGRTLATDGPVAVRLDGGVVTVEPLSLLTGSSRLRIAGTLAAAAGAPPGELRAVGEADLAELVLFSSSLAPATGQVAVDVTVRGSRGELETDGSIQLRDAGLPHPALRDPLREVAADVRIDSSAIRLERFQGRVGRDGRIDADGVLPLALLGLGSGRRAAAGEGEARLRLDATRLSPRDLKATSWRLRGMVSLHVEAHAPRLELEAVSALLRADELSLESTSFELCATGPVEIVVAGGRAALKPLVLDGPGTRIALQGSSRLSADGPMAVTASGEVDLGAVSLLSSDFHGSGSTHFELEASGSPRAPGLRGWLDLRGGMIEASTPALHAEGLELELALAGRRFDVGVLKASLNGGTLEGSGWVDLGGAGPPRADARLTTRGVYLDLPSGLHTVTDADLTLGNRDDGLLLVGGRARIAEGSYTETLDLQEWLRDHFRSGRQVDLTEPTDRELPKVAFDVSLRSRQPIEVENNLARVGARIRLQLTGTSEHPGLLGRAESEEGGEVYLNGRKFVVERGVATFTSESRVLPTLDLLAQTSLAGYDVSLAIAGETGRFTTSLTSTPELAEPDILSLLLTGRTLEQVSGAEGDVAKEQLLSFVSGRLGGFLERRGQSALGLSRVRIEPSVVAGQSDPNARLTLEQELSRRLTLAFSTDLAGGGGDLTYIVDYDIGKSLDMRAVRQDDGSYRTELAQRLRFGGRTQQQRTRRRTRSRERRVGEITIEGNQHLDRRRLLDELDLEPGDKVTFLRIRKGSEEIRERYADEGLLEARVRVTSTTRGASPAGEPDGSGGGSASPAAEPDRSGADVASPVPEAATSGAGSAPTQVTPGTSVPGSTSPGRQRGRDGAGSDSPPVARVVDLDLRIEEGPRVEFVFDGAPVSKDLRSRAERIWRAGAVDPQRRGELRREVRQDLVRAGHLEARVEVTSEVQADGRKRVRVEVRPGPRNTALDLLVIGASPETTRDLEQRFDDRKARAELLVRPWQRARELTRLLRDSGRLDAKVERPRLEKDPQSGRSRIRLEVNEGPAYVLGELRLEGNRDLSEEELRGALRVQPGEPHSPDLLDLAIRSVQELYWARGYDRATVSSELRRGPVKGTVDLSLRIDEGSPRVVAGVRVEGNEQCSERLVKSQLEVKPGELLLDEQMTRSRRNLYDTGAFTLVEVRTTPAGPGEMPVEPPPQARPVDVVARVREQRPFEARYGVFYDSERGAGLSLDLLNRNSLGGARTVGAHFRRDGELREARLFAGQPLLRRFPIKTTISVYQSREVGSGARGSRALREGEQFDREGLSLVQERRVGQRWSATWGYRLERLTGLIVADALEQGAAAQPRSVRIAPIVGSLSRDTRDELLDATRGTFLSQALEIGPHFLGSEVEIARYHAQHARYYSFGGTRPDRFDQTRRIPRFVWASSLRLGLGHGLEDQPVASSTRFYAGGANTVRGFAQDAIGPRLPDGRPSGGNALLVANTEVRFPLVWILDGAAFIDAGNVYNRVADMDLGELRFAAGLGLRVRTPYVVLRIDHGVNLDRRPGESAGASFFSIGQAF